MKRIVARRLAALVPLVWLVATLTFVVLQAAPGSYADTIDNPRLSPQTREMIRARYGLDLPAGEQYLKWLGAVLSGDLGSSFLYKEPVSRVLSRALPPTLLLTGSGLMLTLVLGLVLALLVFSIRARPGDAAIAGFIVGLLADSPAGHSRMQSMLRLPARYPGRAACMSGSHLLLQRTLILKSLLLMRFLLLEMLSFKRNVLERWVMLVRKRVERCFLLVTIWEL